LFFISIILIGSGLIGLGTIALFHSGDSTFSMMGYGMMEPNPMREMMHQMMPDLVPPGTSPENLPDSDSRGARLLVQYCAQCHNLPNPSMHSAGEWPEVVDRMIHRMSRMSGTSGMGMMMNIEIPSTEEQQTIVAYLKAHSLKTIAPRTLPSPESQGAILFKERCSQCHSLPDPTLHTGAEWPGTVEKMRAYMQAMDKKVITKDEEKEIVGYLQNHARK
jgi:mono/diheme cytochrome c family protein